MSVIVIGNTAYSKMLMEYIEETGLYVDAFAVDEKYIRETVISGKPVISFSKLSSAYSRETTILFLGIGYSKLGIVKKDLFLFLKHNGFRFANFIHKTACISSNTSIGEGNVFFENVVVQRNTIIGDGNLFFSNATIMHDNSIGNFNSFCAGSVVNGFVTIDDCNFIGANATIREKIKIKDNNLIGASVYVNRNIETDCAVLPPTSKITYGAAQKKASSL